MKDKRDIRKVATLKFTRDEYDFIEKITDRTRNTFPAFLELAALHYAKVQTEIQNAADSSTQNTTPNKNHMAPEEEFELD